MRALRVSKMTYAALEATLREYAAGRADRTVPAARMMAMEPGEIRSRAESLLARGANPQLRLELADGVSTIGGGSAPGSALPTHLIAIVHESLGADELMTRLRQSDPPVVARIQDERVVLDLRTVEPDQDDELARTLGRL
jgi:L-seryl-tRNA(Ser) seleniumtransferase